MIRTAEHLAQMPADEHKHIEIRCALPSAGTPGTPGVLGALESSSAAGGDHSGGGGGGDVAFLDHLQRQYSNQLGFLPRQALEGHVARNNVSIAMENGEPAAYLLGKGNYLRDPHFGIIYQAAVSYDARRRLLGTALVQHFMDHMAPTIRLIGLWCAQDIEANEFWSACGFEAIAARHGSRRRGRVHIFWVGRTLRGRHEQLRYPRFTRGGLMREHREVFGIEPGEEYTNIVLPPPPPPEWPPPPERAPAPPPDGVPTDSDSQDAGGVKSGSRARRRGSAQHASLIEQQRAFRYGQGKHICVVIHGETKYLPVAPFDLPNFTDLARTMVAVPDVGVNSSPTKRRGEKRELRPLSGQKAQSGGGGLWTPVKREVARSLTNNIPGS